VSVPQTVGVYDWEYGADGETPMVGYRVVAYPSTKGAYKSWGGIAHKPGKVVVVTDAEGYWYMDVAQDMKYDFDLTSTRNRIFTNVLTPESGSAQLGTLLGGG